MSKIIHYIYYIYHVSKKRYYVGETQDYIHRFEQHMSYGKRGYLSKDDLYSKRGLYLAMHKYGITDFIFRVIEICDYEERYKREAFWICKLKSHTINGYNSIVGIDGVRLHAMCKSKYVKLSIEDCKKILAKKNNIEYVEASNYIEPELLEYSCKIKNTINISKLQTKNSESANKSQSEEKSLKYTYKCRKGYTNIYIFKDIKLNKIYIGTSQLNNENDIIKWNINRSIDYINKNTYSPVLYDLFQYINKNKNTSIFKVEFIKRNTKAIRLDYLEVYNILKIHGYNICNLMSETQKERIYDEISKVKDI